MISFSPNAASLAESSYSCIALEPHLVENIAVGYLTLQNHGDVEVRAGMSTFSICTTVDPLYYTLPLTICINLSPTERGYRTIETSWTNAADIELASAKLVQCLLHWLNMGWAIISLLDLYSGWILPFGIFVWRSPDPFHLNAAAYPLFSSSRKLSTLGLLRDLHNTWPRLKPSKKMSTSTL